MSMTQEEHSVLAKRVLDEEQAVVGKMISEREKMVNFLLGQCMKRDKSINPSVVKQIIREELDR